MSISAGARSCLESFNDLFKLPNRRGTSEQAMVENQFGRFKLWASNTGVFAGQRASMDYRLQDVPDLQRLVVRLLETLQDHIKDCLFSPSLISVPEAFLFRNRISFYEHIVSIRIDSNR